MSKYIIDRSLSFTDAPIKGAKKEQVHLVSFISKGEVQRNPQEWERFKATHADIVFDDPYYRGFNCEPEMAWVAEIDDLHRLVKKEGQIILSEPNNAEGYWNIEIYDGYRE